MSKKVKDRLKRVQQMQELMDAATKDLVDIRKFRKELLSINKKMKQLSEYYGNDWIKDYERQSEIKELENYKILGQDPLFELMQDHYIEMKKLLLVCANEINKA